MNHAPDKSRLIWKLAKNDFKTRYAGSYLGVIWALVQPVVTVALYYFVFVLMHMFLQRLLELLVLLLQNILVLLMIQLQLNILLMVYFL